MLMEKRKSFVSNLLKIEVHENGGSIITRWTGKSVERNPSKFITPILVDLLKKSSDRKKRIVLDFQKLDYMNSSTITPVIKILERAKRGKVKISVIYDKNLKWQDLSFSALEIFETKDKRVEIKGRN
jgi:hypothetical protein